ncbi:MAG: hypothetical protein HY619_05360 [Thaumarchaeota archaeon]|nr:hypothetical protein [Nitrososphaerota archaeon]
MFQPASCSGGWKKSTGDLLALLDTSLVVKEVGKTGDETTYWRSSDSFGGHIYVTSLEMLLMRKGEHRL